MKLLVPLEKIKSMLGTQYERVPLVSLFVPIRGTYLPSVSIFNGLVRSANLILGREGLAKISIEHPDWDAWKKDGARTLAIYHAAGMTTLVPLALAMEPRVVVAKSFHVKPLMASSLLNGEALLLTFQRGGCTLHRVSSLTSEHIDTFVPAKFANDGEWLEKISRKDIRDFLAYLEAEVRSHLKESIRFLAIDCPNDPILRNDNYWSRLNLPVKILPDMGLAAVEDRSVNLVQAALEEELSTQVHGHLHAVVSQCTLKAVADLEGLAAHIVKKTISKLVVSLEDLQFGKFDQETGKMSLSKGQRDTEDDDLLDDFAELAVCHGIEVYVVPRKFLPPGRTFMVA